MLPSMSIFVAKDFSDIYLVDDSVGWTGSKVLH